MSKQAARSSSQAAEDLENNEYQHQTVQDDGAALMRGLANVNNRRKGLERESCAWERPNKIVATKSYKPDNIRNNRCE